MIVTEEQVTAWEERMKERHAEEQREADEQAERDRNAYLWRTKRAELRP